MNGDGTFNAQILIDKLAKLNSSQQSIETLSHWCIFHRKNARQVVETWEQQFHFSPKDQRVSFLYLANDILQNSRRKGMEFVGEFWRVLPDALNDVIENGDEFGRKAALRLKMCQCFSNCDRLRIDLSHPKYHDNVDIWEERKVFNPRGQTLKEELLGRNKNGKNISYKLKQPGDMLAKLTLSYQHVYNSCDEDALCKCGAAISSILKVEADMGTDFNLGNNTGSSDELRVQHGILRECIEQLKAAESSRTTLVSHLRAALKEQELKIGSLQSQLEVAQVRYEQVGRLLLGQAPPLPDKNLDEIPPPPPASAYSEAQLPPDFPPEPPSITIRDGVQPTAVNCTPQQLQGPTSDITSPLPTEENRTAASDVATKLTSPASSAHMPSYVFAALAPEGIVGQSMSEDHSSDACKRRRLNNDSLANEPCFPPQSQQPPPPPFPHPDSMHQPPPPPLPPTMLPIPPPPPPVAGSASIPSFSYVSPPLHPMPGFPVVGVPPYPGPPSPYQFQGSDGGFFSPPSYPAGPPSISRQ